MAIDKIIKDGVTHEIVPEIAPLFNTSTSYSIGDCVIKDAVLYRFKAIHLAGPWSVSEVNAINVTDELTELRADLTNLADETVTFTETNGQYVNATTGALSTSVNWKFTGFTDISKYKALAYNRATSTTASTSQYAVVGMAFYSADNISSYLSGELIRYGASSNASEEAFVVVPDGAKYMRMSMWASASRGEFMLKGYYDANLLVEELNTGLDLVTDAVINNNLVYYGHQADRTTDTVTWTWNGDTVHIVGVAETRTMGIFRTTDIGTLIKTDTEYYVNYYLTGTTPGVALEVMVIDPQVSTEYMTVLTLNGTNRTGATFSVPSTATNLAFRLNVANATSSNDCYCTVSVIPLPRTVFTSHPDVYRAVEEYDADEMINNGIYPLNSSKGESAYLNFPDASIPNTYGGGMFVVDCTGSGRFVRQYLLTYGNRCWTRYKSGTSWGAWTEFYHNADAFALAEFHMITPTGDDTDRKATIESALNSYGVCRLAPGDYYVSGIDMPENGMILGSGRSTRIILLGETTDEGYAIKLNDYCTVRDVLILGSLTSIGYPSSYSYVERHGILFSATYSSDESTRKRCIVSGCEIREFTGGGITCKDTGYPVDSTLMVTDTYIINCMVGINIPYWSEFNRFTNCRCFECYYGSVNNGGNNIFVSCDFSTNRVGMLLDNTDGNSINNTHGSVIGCTFNHMNGNYGTGIKMIGCASGQVFSDCQIFYSDIYVSNCQGVQFNNCNGRSVDITVLKGASGGLVMFNNFVFKDDTYTVSIESGYSGVKFNNCWTRSGEAVTA